MPERPEYEVIVPEDAARTPELPELMGSVSIYLDHYAEEARKANGLPRGLRDYVGMTTSAYWESDRSVNVTVAFADSALGRMARESLDGGLAEEVAGG